jgi:hypothetical protein
MRKPGAQRPGGQGLAANRRQQGVRIVRVGARQRQHNAVGRPTGELAGTHGLLQRLGQLADQGQTATHPALVLAQSAGDALLGQAPIDQACHQPPLFDRLPRARLVLPHHLEQPLSHAARPHLGQCGIAPELTQRLHAPVAVEQHQRLGVGHHGDGALLPMCLKGLGQAANAGRIADACAGKTQFQAMQVDLDGLVGVTIHAPQPNARKPPRRSSPLFASTRSTRLRD